jgi:AcrR family transcriptional regulator
MERDDIPLSDPTPKLAPTARRILDAAQRVLVRDGFRALTFEAIAGEAGENPALIRYHFGSKAGLISALVDAVLYFEAVELIQTLSAAPAGRKRREALFRLHRKMARDRESYTAYYELIPHVLRDRELRPKLRALMEWYRRLDAWALSGRADEQEMAALEPLSSLTVAVLDGLALQVEADPGFDIEPVFRLWEDLVFGYLREATPA